MRLRLHDAQPEANTDALLTGKLELGVIFVRAKPGALRGLQFLQLSGEHLCLAVPPTHRFARRRCVRIEDAARERFIVLTPDLFPDYHYFIDTVFAWTRKPKIVEERDSVPGIVDAVEACVGVALVGEMFTHIFGERIKLLSLVPEPRGVPIGLAARKGALSPAAEKFWQCAQ